MNKKLRIVDINALQRPGPETVADLFCDLNSEEMAVFFNAVAKKTGSWATGGIDMQMAYVVSDERMTDDGLNLLKTMGQYAESPE